MYYYKIAISSNSLKGVNELTYSCNERLNPGRIVQVQLRNNLCLGIVISETKALKKTKTKSISKLYNALLPKSSLDLLKWLNQYYPGDFGSCVSLFLPNQMIDEPFPAKKEATTKPKLPALTLQQKNAIRTISNDAINSIFLLHGDTGTGKTRVYIELAKDSIKNDKSVVILVPEISLSPQLAKEFENIFGNKVLTVHSKLTPKQRAMLWGKIQSSDSPLVIIGPRSALFSPLKQMGLVIIEESHDDSYKQSQSPNYDARRVAAKMGMIRGAAVVYGTATPNISDYKNFQDHDIPIIRMDQPVSRAIKLAKTKWIDSKDRSVFTKSSIFSNASLSSIEQSLKNHNQILVFLNRRGTARVVICESCGWLATCPECDTNQIYHGDSHQLICHICGRKSTAPSSCPSCNKTNLSYKSHGTKSIENELNKLFSHAKVMRFDSDNLKKDSLQEQYHEVLNGNIDIIIGTQIIAKGLHLPKLNLVCIPFADNGITLPDFSSEEKSYQLLQQVFGRVGRTKNDSSVIVQSFSSNSPVLKSVLSNNWSNFYRTQLLQREKYHLPPYYYLLQLTIRRKTTQNAQKNAMNLKTKLLSANNNIEILGPSPRFYNKTSGNYNWQLIVKSRSRGQLVNIIKTLPSGWLSNIDPVNLL